MSNRFTAIRETVLSVLGAVALTATLVGAAVIPAQTAAAAVLGL